MQTLSMSLVLLGASLVSIPSNAQEPAMPEPNRGWEELAEILDALTPSIDTEEALSGTAIAAEIESLINHGRAAQALEKIESREAEIAASTSPGTDVQLMFQKARALQALGRTDQARGLYEEMTLRFPELAQPWNNLAILYSNDGRLDEAQQALLTASSNDPNYGQALANLADVRLLLALRDYREAAKLGTPGARKRLEQLESFVNSTRP